MIEQEQYQSQNLPKDLTELLSENTCTRNKIGCSSDDNRRVCECVALPINHHFGNRCRETLIFLSQGG